MADHWVHVQGTDLVALRKAHAAFVGARFEWPTQAPSKSRRLAGAAAKLDAGWAHTSRCATRYRRGPWLVGGARGRRLWRSELVRLAMVLGNKIFTKTQGRRAAVVRSRALGKYGHGDGGVFTSVTINWLAKDGEVLEHTDDDHETSGVVSFDVGDEPSNARLHIGSRAIPTGSVALCDLSQSHRVTRVTAAGGRRVSIVLYAKKAVLRAAETAVGARCHTERSHGHRPARKRISMRFGDGLRYRGTVVEESMLKSGTYLVRFDDGDQLWVDLRTQQRLGRVTELVCE